MGHRTPIGRGEAVTTLLTGATIRWRVATSGSDGPGPLNEPRGRCDDAGVRMRNRVGLSAVSTVVAVGALTAGSFFVGSHNPAVTVVSGYVHVGDGVASAFADGLWYGIPTDVAWLGTDGSWRQDGTAPCLAWTGTPRDVTIKFGWVPITYPNGGGWRQVVWVSCGG